jgi:hypothetical protein
MDTRTTRLRSAARTAVAKALSDEKENPRGVATRSRTKSECDLFLHFHFQFSICATSSRCAPQHLCHLSWRRGEVVR